MPRGDKKAYETLTARMPQDLVNAARRYASLHRSTVAELLREGLEMRLEAGDVPGRSTPDAEVRPEVIPQDPAAEAVTISWQPETITAPASQTRRYYRQPENAPTFDPTRYAVGALCPEQHRYQGQEGSLRYVHGEHTCVACRRERNARYNAQKRARQAQRMAAPQSG